MKGREVKGRDGREGKGRGLEVIEREKRKGEEEKGRKGKRGEVKEIYEKEWKLKGRKDKGK